MIEDPHTHPKPETLDSTEVSQEAWALANEMRDVLRAEEAYAICERHLSAAFERGALSIQGDNLLYDLETRIIELEARLAQGE